MSDEMDEPPADPIAEIEWTWAGAYEAWIEGDWWYARAKAGGPVLSAPSESKLRTLIRADYDKRPHAPRPTDQGTQ